MKDFFNSIVQTTKEVADRKDKERVRIDSEIKHIKRRIQEKALEGEYSMTLNKALLHQMTISEIKEAGFQIQQNGDFSIVVSWYPAGFESDTIAPINFETEKGRR